MKYTPHSKDQTPFSPREGQRSEPKQIAILGSTGSIGTQALQVIAAHPDRFAARVLTANNRWELLAEQARQFMPAAVVIANENYYPALRDSLADLPIAVYAGADALCQVVEGTEVDIVLTAMVGFAGLPPTIAAIKEDTRKMAGDDSYQIDIGV